MLLQNQIDRAKELEIDVAQLKGITQDSRDVQDGYLFAALKGEKTDGYDFIAEAISRGASIILTHKPYSLQKSCNKAVKIITSDNPARDLSLLAALFYAPLPEHIIALTGTNGKSSVVHFISQLWRNMGIKGAMIGTLTGDMTTPDPVSLFRELSRLKQEEGINHIAIEASSHGLSQHRIDGLCLQVAAFTNFTQDHLDYHMDMDSYFAAKTRLFEEILPLGGAAVLNADAPSYASLKDICKRRGIRALSYGRQGTEIKLETLKPEGTSQKTTINMAAGRYALCLPFVGEFQLMNILCAASCLMALGEKPELIAEQLPKLQTVPGRLQHIGKSLPACEYNAYVDYAHTPDALETALKALRPHTQNRLICIFGCGGDRDKSKRPQMGEIAARLADIAIITNDNPRTENAEQIRKQIEQGIPPQSKSKTEIFNIADRGKAIEKAVSIMKEGDILLLAGKGHEQGQIIGDKKIPFDDRCELARAFENLSLSTTSNINPKKTEKGKSNLDD